MNVVDISETPPTTSSVRSLHPPSTNTLLERRTNHAGGMLQMMMKDFDLDAASSSAGNSLTQSSTMNGGSGPPTVSTYNSSQNRSGDNGSEAPPPPYGADKDAKLQMMLEKYQEVVRAQHSTEVAAHTATMAAWPAMASSGHAEHSHTPTAAQSMSHSQPCLINIDRKDHPYSEAEKRRLAYTRGHSTEQSCFGGGGPALSSIAPLRMPPPHPQQETYSIAALPPPPVTPTFKVGQPSASGGSQLIIKSLRAQIEILQQKEQRVKQLESAQERLEAEYEILLQDKDKAEKLERAAYLALEQQNKKLMSEKESLFERLNAAPPPPPADFSAQMNMARTTMQHLKDTNELLKAETERHKRELSAQTANLNEQRSLIELLKTKFEKEKQKNNIHSHEIVQLKVQAERAAQLQLVLQDTRSDMISQQQQHAADRSQMEMELTSLKMHLNKESAMTGGVKKTASATSGTNEDTIARLRKDLKKQKDQNIQLELNLLDVQQKFDKAKQDNLTMSMNFSGQLRLLQDEKSEKDKRIAQLIEKNQKMQEMLGDSEEDETREQRDLHRMEELRQRIQDRKKKNRHLSGFGLTRSLHQSISPSTSSVSAHNQHPPLHQPLTAQQAQVQAQLYGAVSPQQLHAHQSGLVSPISVGYTNGGVSAHQLPSLATLPASSSSSSVSPSGDPNSFAHLYMYSRTPHPYPLNPPTVMDATQFPSTREADL